MTQATAHDHKLDLTSRGAARHVDRMLDKAVEDSFPASDPVALSMPHDRVETRFPALKRMSDQLDAPTLTTLVLGGGLIALIAILALRK